MNTHKVIESACEKEKLNATNESASKAVSPSQEAEKTILDIIKTWGEQKYTAKKIKQYVDTLWRGRITKALDYLDKEGISMPLYIRAIRDMRRELLGEKK